MNSGGSDDRVVCDIEANGGGMMKMGIYKSRRNAEGTRKGRGVLPPATKLIISNRKKAVVFYVIE